MKGNLIRRKVRGQEGLKGGEDSLFPSGRLQTLVDTDGEGISEPADLMYARGLKSQSNHKLSRQCHVT